MAEAFLFLLGFTSVTAVYEIAKTGKKTKTDRMNRAADSWRKQYKKGGETRSVTSGVAFLILLFVVNIFHDIRDTTL